MGSMQDILGMIPGMGQMKNMQVDEKALARVEALIQSMTPYERENPAVLNSSRKRRVALGSGQKVEDVNRLLKQFEQMQQMKKMGSFEDILKVIPGIGNKLAEIKIDEKKMGRIQAIIQSMTPYERENPSVLNSSRKRRIALGSGVKVEDINKLLKQFDMMNQMMKQFSGPGAAKKMKRMGKFGGMGGLGGFPGL